MMLVPDWTVRWLPGRAVVMAEPGHRRSLTDNAPAGWREETDAEYRARLLQIYGWNRGIPTVSKPMKAPAHVYVRRRTEHSAELSERRMKTELDFWKGLAEGLQDQIEAIADAADDGREIIIDVVGRKMITLVVKPGDGQGKAS